MRGLVVKARHMVEKVNMVDHLLCLHRAHDSQGPHPGAAEDKTPLLCHVVQKTHDRPSAVSGWRGHTADSLCRRYQCRDLSVVCLHTAEGLPCSKAALPCLWPTRQTLGFR
jgi:hypothetical protein